MLEGLMRFLRISNFEDKLEVRCLSIDDDDNGDDIEGWYIVYPDGEPYAGPYKRAADARGQLTRMRNQYTPAARRPRTNG